MRLSLPGKIFASFVALMLTFGGVMTYTVWEVDQLGSTLTRLHTSLMPLPSMVAELKSDLRRMALVAGLTESSSLKRAVDHLRKVDRTPERFAEKLSKVRERLARRDGSEAARDLLAQFETLKAESEVMATQLAKFFSVVDGEGDPTMLKRPTRRAIARVARQVEFFGIETDRALSRTIDVFEQEEDRVSWGAIVLASVAIFLGLLITFNSNRLLRPLRALRAGVERVAEGRYDEPVQASAPDELGLLAAEFNRMAEAIRRRDAQLSSQQKTLLERGQLATVGRMSAQITHELRNPLTSIGLNSELLMEELEAYEGAHQLTSARDLLVNIIKEVERLKEITEEYLRFSRLPVPEKNTVDLNHTAAELLEFVRSEMDLAKVKTRLDLDPAPTPARVDPNQIRAALLNLLRNAREAMPEGGHIVMRIRSLSNQVFVEVTDSGGGISQDVRARLYEPFFSTKAQGTGLGLSMVKQIIDAHEGTIEVESQAATGTTFRLIFASATASQDAELPEK